MKYISMYLITEQSSNTATYWYDDFLHGVMSKLNKGTSLNIIDLAEHDLETSISSLDIDIPRMIVTGTSLPWISDVALYLNSLQIHPILVCSQPGNLKFDYSNVTFSHLNTSLELTRYLILLERKRIGFFGMDPDSLADMHKYEGYCTALEESGIKASPDDLFINKGLIGESINQLLCNIKKYDAIVCTNDYIALCLMSSMISQGISIPDDIYVTGFGDTFAGRVSMPSLTTATLDFYESGRKAVDIYNFLEKNPDLACMSATVKCKIKVRESTGNRVLEGITPYRLHDLKNEIGIDMYSKDPDINEVLCLENLLQQSDNFDGSILEDVINGMKYMDIAEHLNMSEKTIQYRLNKMFAACKKKSKNELIYFIEKYLGKDAGTRITREKLKDYT